VNLFGWILIGSGKFLHAPRRHCAFSAFPFLAPVLRHGPWHPDVKKSVAGAWGLGPSGGRVSWGDPYRGFFKINVSEPHVSRCFIFHCSPKTLLDDNCPSRRVSTFSQCSLPPIFVGSRAPLPSLKVSCPSYRLPFLHSLPRIVPKTKGAETLTSNRPMLRYPLPYQAVLKRQALPAAKTFGRANVIIDSNCSRQPEPGWNFPKSLAVLVYWIQWRPLSVLAQEIW